MQPNNRHSKIPLSSFTTFGVGGPATEFSEVTESDKLAHLMLRVCLKEYPLAWIGHGSNVLMHDAGFPGLVVGLGAKFARGKLTVSHVTVEAGASLSGLVKLCCKQGILNLSCCAGIPGTCGGAAYMNAGTKNGEVSRKIPWIELLDPTRGSLELGSSQEMDFAYRTSILQQESRIVTRIAFSREEGDGKVWWEKARAQITRGKKLQPQGVRTAGSFFRNPPGHVAGVLIERAGLKETRIGDAMVSPVHGNFLVNLRHARSDDIVHLIKLVRKHVFEQFGVRLDLEISLMGFSEDEAAELRD